MVFQKKLDTKTSKEIILDNTKKWISGSYKIVFEALDNHNQLVKDEQIFELFGQTDKQIPDNKLLVISTDKTTYQPNDNVKLTIGSASKDITVVVNVEKNHTVVASHFIQLNNSLKTLLIPVSKEDEGGFSIKYHFVNYNSFENGIIPISVPYNKSSLTIETLTFKDKLQPGSQQTWSFKISGS